MDFSAVGWWYDFIHHAFDVRNTGDSAGNFIRDLLFHRILDVFRGFRIRIAGFSDALLFRADMHVALAGRYRYFQIPLTGIFNGGLDPAADREIGNRLTGFRGYAK